MPVIVSLFFDQRSLFPTEFHVLLFGVANLETCGDYVRLTVELGEMTWTNCSMKQFSSGVRQENSLP